MAYNSQLMSHRKFKKLSRLLPGEHPAKLRGHLELIWDAANDASENNETFADRGDIELVSDWDGADGALLVALLAAGFLDEGDGGAVVVHDYWDWAPYYVTERVKKRAQRQSKRLQARELPETSAESVPGQSQDSPANSRDSLTSTSTSTSTLPLTSTVNENANSVTETDHDPTSRLDHRANGTPPSQAKSKKPRSHAEPSTPPEANAEGVSFDTHSKNGTDLDRKKHIAAIVEATQARLRNGKPDAAILSEAEKAHGDDSEAMDVVRDAIEAHRRIYPSEHFDPQNLDTVEVIVQRLVAQGLGNSAIVEDARRTGNAELVRGVELFLREIQSRSYEDRLAGRVPPPAFPPKAGDIDALVERCNTIEGGKKSAAWYRKRIGEIAQYRDAWATAHSVVKNFEERKQRGDDSVGSWGAVLNKALRGVDTWSAEGRLEESGVPF